MDSYDATLHDAELIAAWREMRDINLAALEEIATGKAHRPYSPAETAGIRAEVDRLDSLIAAYEANRDA